MVLVGLDRQLQQLREWIQAWELGMPTKKGCILYGPPGVGKTESTYKIAKEFDYEVVEFNASDERGKEFTNELKRIVQTKSLVKTLILLDEVDGAEDQKGIAEAVQLSCKPIIMTCNDIRKINDKLKEVSAIIYYPRPDLSNIVRAVKLRDYSKVIPDFRQAKLMRYGSMGYDPIPMSRREKLEKMVRSGKYDDIDDVDLVYLLDNAPYMFYGWRLYMYIRALETVDICKRPHPLNCLNYRKVTKIGESYFFSKVKSNAKV